MIMDMPKIGWVERLLADVEVMTMDEMLAVERQQHHLEREIDRGIGLSAPVSRKYTRGIDRLPFQYRCYSYKNLCHLYFSITFAGRRTNWH